MSAWDAYIDTLKSANPDGTVPVKEAAIWGYQPGQESEWASSSGLKDITAADIRILAGDRSGFRMSGPTIAGMKCMLLTDKMDDETAYSLNMKTKAQGDKPAYSLCIGKTFTAFIITLGPNEAGPGVLCDKAFKTIQHLRKSNM